MQLTKAKKPNYTHEDSFLHYAVFAIS